MRSFVRRRAAAGIIDMHLPCAWAPAKCRRRTREERCHPPGTPVKLYGDPPKDIGVRWNRERREKKESCAAGEHSRRTDAD